jgi:hypothetical protein
MRGSGLALEVVEAHQRELAAADVDLDQVGVLVVAVGGGGGADVGAQQRGQALDQSG